MSLLSSNTLSVQELLKGYRSSAFSVNSVMDTVFERLETADKRIWINRFSREDVQTYVENLKSKSPDELPLYGVPFAVKDNIDLDGLPTTAACPAFEYNPDSSAVVVQHLIDAGAIPIGKTNLDQFATGLVGVRSPYGVPANSFNEDYIPGGSSSGSAVAVASGLVSFALGTDTAGSGRVPASFNNLVGVKPTYGMLSSRGMVPACKTLDCMSIFALNCEDAECVLKIAGQYDEADAFAREPISMEPQELGKVVGVPLDEQLQFFGDSDAQGIFDDAIKRVSEIGGRIERIDFQPFLDAARMLYEGAWVAERYIAAQKLIENSPEVLHPTTRTIIGGGIHPKATDAFKAQYQLMEYKRMAELQMKAVDCVMTPTAGTIYTLSDLEKEPILYNSNLGYYTNFINLLDYSALAVPAGFRGDGMPWGVTFFAHAWKDYPLLELGAKFQEHTGFLNGADAKN